MKAAANAASALGWHPAPHAAAMRPEPAPYRIARMSRDDLGRTLDWAAAEGWNPGRHDLDAFHAAFGTTDGDALWLPKEERITIW